MYFMIFLEGLAFSTALMKQGQGCCGVRVFGCSRVTVFLGCSLNPQPGLQCPGTQAPSRRWSLPMPRWETSMARRAPCWPCRVAASPPTPSLTAVCWMHARRKATSNVPRRSSPSCSNRTSSQTSCRTLPWQEPLQHFARNALIRNPLGQSFPC